MPNWVSNRTIIKRHGFLDLSKSDRDIAAREIAEIFDAMQRETFCDYFVPAPADADATWRLENWNTKWEIGSGAPDRGITCSSGMSPDGTFEMWLEYQSACSSPFAVFQAIHERGYEVINVAVDPIVGVSAIQEFKADGTIEMFADELDPELGAASPAAKEARAAFVSRFQLEYLYNEDGSFKGEKERIRLVCERENAMRVARGEEPMLYVDASDSGYSNVDIAANPQLIENQPKVFNGYAEVA